MRSVAKHDQTNARSRTAWANESPAQKPAVRDERMICLPTCPNFLADNLVCAQYSLCWMQRCREAFFAYLGHETASA